MDEIKAIPTRYKGYLFRSRLEARWAVFFDTLGIQWEYEPEGIQVNNTTRYLPDFMLMPGEQVYFAEVKHGNITLGDKETKKAQLAASSPGGLPIILLNGPPDFKRLWHVFDHDGVNFLCFFRDYGEKIQLADDYWTSQTVIHSETGNIFFLHENDHQIIKSFGAGLLSAVEAARSARFEHGESPSVASR